MNKQSKVDQFDLSTRLYRPSVRVVYRIGFNISRAHWKSNDNVFRFKSPKSFESDTKFAILIEFQGVSMFVLGLCNYSKNYLFKTKHEFMVFC